MNNIIKNLAAAIKRLSAGEAHQGDINLLEKAGARMTKSGLQFDIDKLTEFTDTPARIIMARLHIDDNIIASEGSRAKLYDRMLSMLGKSGRHSTTRTGRNIGSKQSGDRWTNRR